MPCLAAAIADLGMRKSDLETREYTQIGKDVEKLNQQLIDILLPLKTHLSKEKTKDGPFDLTGDMTDGRRIVDAILDFKNLFEETYGEGKTFTIKDLDLEKLEAVTKEQLTEILSHVDNLETNHKTKTQDSTQMLFLKVNMSLAIFNCLNESQKSHTQHLGRLAQASRGM
ncbi:hypothetical protein [Candidatus Neptunichlamydia sp. REUL1]|uniref:hypothetical protein n=1 Tax=Candidatus Neptunichlamydia sp. REUL1 TaxID=3064277 RepID=UPI00292D952D|nr:hypothetical protein [Candidatus Neptunochlamydia sp. REUL1]